MTSPIIARLPTGEEYGYEDEKTARRLYPDAEIIGYQDGTAVEVTSVPATQSAPRKPRNRRKPAPKKVTPEPESTSPSGGETGPESEGA